MKHLFDTKELSKEEIELLLDRAAFWESNQRELKLFSNRFVANLFFEPSTRTRVSFETAEKKLGCNVIHISNEASSTVKGESLYDTIKTLSSIGIEVVVIRHSESAKIQELLQKETGCIIINAGAGRLAHPTQALLDLYTIKKFFGELRGIKVVMIGDIAHSRVVRSNLWALQTVGAKVFVSGPESMRDEEVEKVAPYFPIQQAIKEADVVMMLRVQLERHQSRLFISPEKYLQTYGLTMDRFQLLKPEAMIMHPGPVNRGVEIVDELVEHPRSKIFEQMANGVFIRMAVLERALQGGIEG